MNSSVSKESARYFHASPINELNVKNFSLFAALTNELTIRKLDKPTNNCPSVHPNIKILNCLKLI